ncbi:trans-aconitate methyltransferase [Pseudonocardia sp. EC080610-09]|uniref:trans-aconitate 2-methyltransferase n=1 Tax=unclassified Pseudonocardia TaxID=2619320 RepID=UPI0006CB531B|nr:MULTISPECIES: trans-aconitate 2-methyltransferase [unclassified Pseudonocardia]ALE72810.1 trans-aconitate methyltransferase [Pseudonocardia sp. EC080625-04]ALL76132.1 trans-aconitate methyltransferase [Pseudonocardia sp. EC080610-09]ALL83156.1 trans-aconitate methyltransferase [Pseudonocardia sp. EC080619-01]
MTAASWDPELYRAFDDHRSRPFVDLLARVGAVDPGLPRVVDAGCGPGHLTGLLSRRWPDATVDAFDSSPDMVEAARSAGVDAALTDVRDWTPPRDTGVLVSNAVLQWVPEHADVLRRWIAALAPGAWLAMQVPGNFGAPSHVLTREVAAQPRWRARILLRGDETVLDPLGYADLLAHSGAVVDAWETTYLQRLEGDDPVLRWISGTALRPVRDALDDDAYAAFVDELAPRLRAAYPPSADGSTWFPFRRVFAVARKH